MGPEQIRELQRENGRLRSRLMLAEHRAERAEARVAEQQARIEQLISRVEYLEMLVRSDSEVSSKPPSSDPPWKKALRKAKPTSKKNKRGAQKGHKGHHRQLIPVDHVDAVVEHRPERCQGCDHSLTDARGVIAERAQQTDLPEIGAQVTEHQAVEVVCPGCSMRHRGTLPPEVSGSCFGPRLHAWVATLSGSFQMSKPDIRRLLKEQCGLTISLGGLIKLERRAVQALSAVVEDAHQQIQGGPVAFADETSFRCGADKPYLWSLSNHELSVFRILDGRSQTQASELLGEFKGLLHTDQYGGYNLHPLGKRQLCWAHIDRKLKGLLVWPRNHRVLRKLRGALCKLFTVGRAIRDGTLPRDRRRKICADLTDLLERLWTQASRCRCAFLRAIAHSVLKMKPAWCRFILVSGAEPTNNRAERALRHAVIWRKTSFGTQSHNGNRFREVMFSIHHSLRLQHRSVYDFLQRSFEAYFERRPQPLLTP